MNNKLILVYEKCILFPLYISL